MPTLRDIAKRANTSESTASLILNGRKAHLFAEETRKRVIDAAKEMGYQPRRAAQILATGKTHHVAVVVNDMTNPFFGRYTSLIQAKLVEYGYTAIPLETQGQEDRTAQWLDWLPQRAVDAMIDLQGFMGVNKDIYEQHGTQVPVIFREAVPLSEGVELDHVQIDMQAGFKALADHLEQTGRKHAGYLVTTGQLPTSGGLRHRTRIIKESFEPAGFDVSDACWRGADEGGDLDPWYDAAFDLLRKRPQTDALFVHNIIAVPPVLHAIEKLGRTVGGDVAVASVDDAPQAEWLGPGITVITEPTEQIAEQLAQMTLMKLGEIEGEPVSSCVESKLIVRGSTAAVR